MYKSDLSRKQPQVRRSSIEQQALDASFRDPRTLKSNPTHKIVTTTKKNPLEPTIHNTGEKASKNINNAPFYQRWKERKENNKGGKKRRRRRTKKKRKRRRTKKKRKSRRRKRRRTRK